MNSINGNITYSNNNNYRIRGKTSVQGQFLNTIIRN